MYKYKLKRFFYSFTGILEKRWNAIDAGLYAFNYHRIGNSNDSKFDPNVFSCDEEHFAAQIDTISKKFRIINTQELVELIDKKVTISEPLAMITFDDGYEDNFKNAFPILNAHGIPATFFLPTNFIGTTSIPWWDEAAWLVKNSKVDQILLSGHSEPIPIRSDDLAFSIRQVLRHFKDDTSISIDEKLRELEKACRCEYTNDEAESEIMSWDQVRIMLKSGMDIGSHTQSHRILSHLSLEEQKKELAESKAVLESETQSIISTLAYPVGGLDSYDSDTIRIAKECGYKAAFNFVKGNGYSLTPSDAPFDIVRIPVENQIGPLDIKYSAITAPLL